MSQSKRGQRTTLTGSAPVAVAGDPFTFTCSSEYSLMGYVHWTVHLQHNATIFPIYGGSDNNCQSDDRYKKVYSFTCSRDGPFALTILQVDYKRDHLSNWTCEEILFGGRSNTVSLEVNVPLDSVFLHNSKQSPIAVTKGDDFSLVCETNPTNPPSTITWLMGNQRLTRGVTSQSRDEGGLVVTTSNLTLDVTWDAHNKNISCVGRYGDIRKQSEEFMLNIKVPLLNVEMTNFSSTNMTATENDLASLKCRTNPTRPPASILWVKDGHTITQGVETRMDGEDGRTVTVSTLSFSVTCSDQLTRVQCTGMYGGWNRTTPEVYLFVHCKDEKRAIPSTDKTTVDLGFGAGVGVGISACLVLMAVIVGILIYLRRGNLRNKSGVKNDKIKRSRQEIAVSETAVSTIQNTYDVMDVSSRQVNIRDTYEDIQLYQNTRNASSMM